jgi:glycosyltransferase involved in cell wall biosynthesis
MKVAHVITGLSMGGAERALTELLPALRARAIEGDVFVLGEDQPLGEQIRAEGAPVHALHARPGLPNPLLVTRLSSALREYRPDLVQTWLYHGDLVGGLAARRLGVPVVWGIHHTIARRGDLRPATYLVARLNAWLSSRVPERIVCCAQSSRDTHAALGYQQSKMLVIRNGIDADVFRPGPTYRMDVRAELGLLPHTPLIGLCARFDRQKDHETFFRAASILSRSMPEVHYLLWGQDVDSDSEALVQLVAGARLEGQVHLLGLRTDSPRLMAALDLASLSSSYGEASPLVVGEAMACEIPCVVTDVGDSSYIVGDTGRVVPPRQPAALAGAWEGLLRLLPDEREHLGASARQRVVDLFSLERMAEEYAQLYRDIIGGADRPAQPL